MNNSKVTFVPPCTMGSTLSGRSGISVGARVVPHVKGIINEWMNLWKVINIQWYKKVPSLINNTKAPPQNFRAGIPTCLSSNDWYLLLRPDSSFIQFPSTVEDWSLDTLNPQEEVIYFN